jgi:hypothetical protein
MLGVSNGVNIICFGAWRRRWNNAIAGKTAIEV